MTAFIEANFRMMDGDGDDLVSKNEFRYNCISRVAVDDVKVIDEAFEKLLNVRKFKQIRLIIVNINNFYKILYFYYRTRIRNVVESIWLDIRNFMVNLLVAQMIRITLSTCLAH